MRVFISILLISTSITLSAQYVSLHTQHPFGTCTIGTVYDNVPPADMVDSIMWSTGHVGFTFNAPVGVYQYTPYYNGVAMYTDTLELLQLEWYWDVVESWWAPGSKIFTVQGEVPYYGTTIYQYPCCGPLQGDVVAELYQDSVLIGTENNWYFPPPVGFGIQAVNFLNYVGGMPTGYPSGHLYEVKFIDNGCGHVFWSSAMIVNSCNNLALNTQVTGTVTGQATGVIDFIAAVPDTTEPYPIYSPVAGSFALFQLPAYTQVGPWYNSALNAQWTGLDSGYYVLQYSPDAGCVGILDTIYVPSVATGISGVSHNSAPIYFNAKASLLEAASYVGQRLTVFDAGGNMLVDRIIRSAAIPLHELPTGLYIYKIGDPARPEIGRFVKP